VEVEAGEAGVDADVVRVRPLQHPPHNAVHFGARPVVVVFGQLRRAGLEPEREYHGDGQEDALRTRNAGTRRHRSLRPANQPS
jgi:hypothetical protein